MLTTLLVAGVLWATGAPPAEHRPSPLIPIVVLTAGLWLASAKVARRLGRPLAELTELAREIGAGNWQKRAQLSCRTPDEIGAVAHALEDMAQKIERQMSDQRELLAVVSHELRAPLQRIRLLVELGRDQGVAESTLTALDAEVLAIDGLVGELLASARLDFAALQRTQVDLAALVATATERSGLPAAVLRVDAPAEDLVVSVDATLVQRAIVNLLTNAEKHGGGATGVSVRTRPGWVVVEVEDGGGGFAPGEEQRVFLPFTFREPSAPSADASGVSLGLGLALVKRIADAHGGQVYARNRPAGGATVGIELPR